MNSSIFRKLALATTLVLVSAFTAAAQQMYLKASSSFHFGLGSNPENSGSGNITGNGFSIIHTRVGINYGKGVAFNGAFGYMFNGNVGAELGLGYLKGSKQEAESRYYYPDYLITNTSNYETYSRMTLIQPAIIITTESGKFKPYAKLGLLIALGKIYERQYEALYSESREIKSQYTGGEGFGFQSAAGLTLEANSKLDFFLELTMNNLSYSPETWTVTEAKENNVDVLYKHEKSITFRKAYEQQYNSKGEAINVDQAHKIYLPMSSVGVGLGMKIRL